MAIDESEETRITLSQGGITGTVADVRLVFAAALKANAVSIVLAHNHPSGGVKPSRQDEELTAKIKYARRLSGNKSFGSSYHF